MKRPEPAPPGAAVLGACLLVGACGGGRAPAPARSLRAVLEDVRARHPLPALAAAVVRPDGSVELACVGVRKAGTPTPATTADRWHLGSNTKAFTATLIARLVEKRLLRWETTIGEGLGGAVTVSPRYRGATIEQLLSHGAGLPRDFPPGAAWDRARARTGSLLLQRRDLVAPILSSTPEPGPGSAHAYSNVGFVVAGAMAEAVTARSWEELVVAEVLEPLGIRTAGFGAPGRADVVDQPWGHRAGLFGVVPIPPGPAADNPPALGPAGTLHMSLADDAWFLTDQVLGERGEGRLLTAASYRRLHDDDGRPAWGLGWGVRHLPTWGKVVTHVGSNGRWCHLSWASIDAAVAVAIATNAPDGATTDAAVEETLESILALPGVGSHPAASRRR